MHKVVIKTSIQNKTIIKYFYFLRITDISRHNNLNHMFHRDSIQVNKDQWLMGVAKAMHKEVMDTDSQIMAMDSLVMATDSQVMVNSRLYLSRKRVMVSITESDY